MKLLSGPLSLFSRKVEIALAEKGLPFTREQVAFTQTEGYQPKHPEVLAHNPKRQVPVLIDGDLAVYDSTVIIEYLEDAYPEPRLFPERPAERARCRLYDLFADEILLGSIRPLMHRTTPGLSGTERWASLERDALAAEEALQRHFANLAQRLESRDYLCGAFSAADISVFMGVLFALRLGGPSIAPYPALTDWYVRLLTRPAFSTAAQEIAAADRSLSAPVDTRFSYWA